MCGLELKEGLRSLPDTGAVFGGNSDKLHQRASMYVLLYDGCVITAAINERVCACGHVCG